MNDTRRGFFGRTAACLASLVTIPSLKKDGDEEPVSLVRLKCESCDCVSERPSLDDFVDWEVEFVGAVGEPGEWHAECPECLAESKHLYCEDDPDSSSSSSMSAKHCFRTTVGKLEVDDRFLAAEGSHYKEYAIKSRKSASSCAFLAYSWPRNKNEKVFQHDEVVVKLCYYK